MKQFKTILTNLRLLRIQLLITAFVLLASIAHSQDASKQEAQKWLNNILLSQSSSSDFKYEVNKIRSMENSFKLIKATLHYDCNGGNCSEPRKGMITPKGDTLAPVFKDIVQLSTGNFVLKSGESNFQVTPGLKVTKVYDYFGEFENGLAVFVENGLYGMSTTSGNVVLRPTYDYLSDADNKNRIAARKGDAWQILERKGNNIAKRKNNSKKNPRPIKIRNNETGLWALMNDDADLITPFKYDEVIPLADGYSIGQINYKWGLIDQHGKEMSAFTYDKIYKHLGANYTVTKGLNDPKYGVLNEKGEEVIPVMYEKISQEPLHSKRINGLYWVVKETGNKWGLLDVEGQALTLMRYQKIDVSSYDNPKGLIEGKWKELLKN